MSDPFPQPCPVLKERKRENNTEQQGLGVPLSPRSHPGRHEWRPGLTQCARETITTKEHTPLLPEGSGSELAKGVIWGRVEDRREGKGRFPHLQYLKEKRDSPSHALGAGEDRSQKFSKIILWPPVPLPTFQVSWQLLTFSNPALPQAINYCCGCWLDLSLPSKSICSSDYLKLPTLR